MAISVLFHPRHADDEYRRVCQQGLRPFSENLILLIKAKENEAASGLLLLVTAGRGTNKARPLERLSKTTLPVCLVCV